MLDVSLSPAPPGAVLPSLPPIVGPTRPPRGPADRATSLSPSRAQDFQSCPLLYRFRVLDRLPEPPSPAAVRGTLVHAVLEALYDLPAAQRTLERAIGLLHPQWDRLVAERPEVLEVLAARQAGGPSQGHASADAQPREEAVGWLRGAGDLLEAYFGMEDPRLLEPEARELQVQAELPSGLVLRGFVDRLDQAPTGQLRVVDYKTGRPPRIGYEARAMFQMRFYALVIWRMRGEVPALLQLMYLATGDVLRYAPDEADLQAMERKVDALWTAIRRAVETGDWRPNPGPLCSWCTHQDLCPAWGGTPPPLPDARTGGQP